MGLVRRQGGVSTASDMLDQGWKPGYVAVLPVCRSCNWGLDVLHCVLTAAMVLAGVPLICVVEICIG
jgi:hypothetical protein